MRRNVCEFSLGFLSFIPFVFVFVFIFVFVIIPPHLWTVLPPGCSPVSDSSLHNVSRTFKQESFQILFLNHTSHQKPFDFCLQLKSVILSIKKSSTNEKMLFPTKCPTMTSKSNSHQWWGLLYVLHLPLLSDLTLFAIWRQSLFRSLIVITFYEITFTFVSQFVQHFLSFNNCLKFVHFISASISLPLPTYHHKSQG